MNHKEALNYLYGLEAFGIRFGLSRVKKILRCLGNPEKSLRTVHVAGTNGKGSVSAILSGILVESGYRTGLYTSPHLVEVNERIRINGKYIKNRELDGYTAGIKESLEKSSIKLTYFEFLTVMAFAYFADNAVDVAVIETGMGGRLDATNVIKNPMVCVITNIGRDHTEYLGKDLLSIACEKAGIIKKNSIIVTGERKEDVMEVFEKKCREKGARLLCLGRDFKQKMLYRTNGCQEFNYRGIYGCKYGKLSICLEGIHQVSNAALALAAAEVLKAGGLKLEEEPIRKGLSRAEWAGRLQFMKIHYEEKKFNVLLDGAHNPAGIETLKKYLLEKRPHFRKQALIYGVLGDKDFKRMTSEIVPVADEVIVVAPACDRALPAKELFKEVLKYKSEGSVFLGDTVKGAIKKAFKMCGGNDLICITGSLYTVGEAMKALGYFRKPEGSKRKNDK